MLSTVFKVCYFQYQTAPVSVSVSRLSTAHYCVGSTISGTPSPCVQQDFPSTRRHDFFKVGQVALILSNTTLMLQVNDEISLLFFYTACYLVCLYLCMHHVVTVIITIITLIIYCHDLSKTYHSIYSTVKCVIFTVWLGFCKLVFPSDMPL